MAVRTRTGSQKPLAAERGCLVIADVSGYTDYVVSSPLEHAEDVLADVTDLVAERLGRILVLNKREGDAVFGYALAGDVDGTLLLDAVEQCYFAFRNRLVGIERATSCDCNACAKLPGLDLKFVVHAGDFIRRGDGEREELTGPAVIVAHRLLKNNVTERGYALLTADALSDLGLDPVELGQRPHAETYDDVGELVVYVADLQSRWEAELARRRTLVGAREAAFELVRILPVPQEVAWDFLTAPAKRTLWQGEVEEQASGGRRGPGTTSLCVDGRTTIYEEILDWRPFDYFTETRSLPGGKVVLTTELEQAASGTRMRVRGKVVEKPSRFGAIVRSRRRWNSLEHSYDRLATLLAEES